jgi:RNA polymerase sigma-70 factor (ECF subfamily)
MAIAYRMLGSRAEAEDAVQDTWLRASRAGADDVENLGGWLTTIVARVCLNALRSRASRPEHPVGAQIPEPVLGRVEDSEPEQEAILADAVGLALLVVLEALTPAERLAFVLHDMFDLTFDEIAPMVDRSTAAARQLASRARRRVRDAEVPAGTADLAAARTVVDAFFAAARAGDLDGLVAVLDPRVVLRSDGGSRRAEATAVLHGVASVARRAMMFAQPGAVIRPIRYNGGAGVFVTRDGRPVSVMGFTVRDGRIVEIQSLLDPDRLARIEAP